MLPISDAAPILELFPRNETAAIIQVEKKSEEDAEKQKHNRWEKEKAERKREYLAATRADFVETSASDSDDGRNSGEEKSGKRQLPKILVDKDSSHEVNYCTVLRSFLDHLFQICPLESYNIHILL